MISVTVMYVNRETGDEVADDEITRIFVASETEHAVILSVETKNKYPKPELYTGNGVRFRTTAGHLACLSVKELPFEDSCVIAEAGRGNLFVILFHDVREDARQVYDA